MKKEKEKTNREVKLSKVRGDDIYYVVINGKRVLRLYFYGWNDKPCIHIFKTKTQDILVEEEESEDKEQEG